MKKVLILSAVVACCFFDVTRNASMIDSFMVDGQALFFYIGWLAGAVCIALLPPLLAHFGASKQAQRAALLSAVLSVCAVLSDYVAKENIQVAGAESLAMLEKQLDRVNVDIEKCDKLPARVCSSAELRKNKNILDNKLAQFETSTIFKSDIDNYSKIIIFIGLLAVSIFMPYLTADLAATLKDQPKREPKRVLEPSRNQKSVPDQTKREPKREPKSDTPTADQAKRIAKAYKDLLEKGVKPSQSRLAIEAKVRKAVAATWLKTDNVIKLNSNGERKK